MNAVKYGLRTILLCFVTVATASQVAGETASVTITNPTPQYDDRFGYSVAGVGTDMVLVGAIRKDLGATDTGAAYLFNTSGKLLTTFTNPTPADVEFFGIAVTAVGSDKVLIGCRAHDSGYFAAGVACLFSTNGTLLCTITNPAPEAGDSFGYALAAVGGDKVLIGAEFNDSPGATNSGVAYLFATNGTLLTTFTNPAPARNDWFGAAVTALGTNRVLIGAYGANVGGTDAGAAYLFNINGTLLTTFTNPTPAGFETFGQSLASVGTDKVLVGAYYALGAAPPYTSVPVGAVYLFNTNGTLLHTFQNPTPANEEFFGISLAVLDDDKIVIGAVRDNASGTYTGAAYLYHMNGTLLATFTNSTPVYYDYFAWSLAAVGRNKVIVGAHYVDQGSTDAGAAYLFTASPRLAIAAASSNTIRVSWNSGWTGWAPQQAGGLLPTSWASLVETVTNDGVSSYFEISAPSDSRLFRLVKP